MVWVLQNNQLTEKLEKITLRFDPKRKKTCKLSFGSLLLKKLGWNIGDRIEIFLDDQNPKKWLIKKSDDLINSYVLGKGNFEGSRIVSVITIHVCDLNLEEKHFKAFLVNYEIINNTEVIIFFD